jgi:hypothetical protein
LTPKWTRPNVSSSRRFLDDLHRRVADCAQIRRTAAALPVSGPTTLTEQDTYVVSLLESASADLVAASPLLRSGWLMGRKRDGATNAAARLLEVQRAVIPRYGTEGTGVVLRSYSARGAAEEQQLRTAVQDLRHWQVQAADAFRLSARLPISGPTPLEAAEEQLVQLVERLRGDVEVASQCPCQRTVHQSDRPSTVVKSSEDRVRLCPQGSDPILECLCAAA